MAAITRRVTDSSAIAASRIAAVASMELEIKHFANIKGLLEKAQDKIFKQICDKDEVRATYQTLEKAQNLVLDGKATMESHINEEESVLMQFFAADDISRMIKMEIFACVSRLRADRRKREDETH
ncbi:hypothetical protein BDBG_03386 [Blastomyces gilchristii SLH14081]|uniref:Uncharacterized protein n=1 Tax=Blastomyces gilchristii (strain SLH14081) TaxID=559298 RepID=A0A179UH54_BLAGS|nr:uncharacterized protein BDBG_03386 [Blastomyces gilchristii SLH14081]OAT07314.1 hypothetical protein BDBG_03386 [Blastomyces gilchristii SLH14081]